MLHIHKVYVCEVHWARQAGLGSLSNNSILKTRTGKPAKSGTKKTHTYINHTCTPSYKNDKVRNNFLPVLVHIWSIASQDYCVIEACCDQMPKGREMFPFFSQPLCCSGRIFFILSEVNNKAKQEASKQDDPLNQRDQNKKENGSNTAHPSKSFFACFVGLMTSDVKTGVCKLSFVILCSFMPMWSYTKETNSIHQYIQKAKKVRFWFQFS